MNENVENIMELLRWFLFHYRNWIEAWILEYPADMFESQAAYSAAFEVVNRKKISPVILKYNLSPNRGLLCKNLLKPRENG